MEQTNPYIKQFPELFRGKKILYVHGFGSSGSSGTVARLREVLPEADVAAPDLPIHPEEAMTLLETLCREEHPDLIIGTSMGGMYAEMLRGYDRILINPALRMGDTMKEHGLTGTQHFYSQRRDGVQEFIVTKSLVKEYRDITERCLAECNAPEEQQRVWGLFGDEDPIVHTYGLFCEHYAQAMRFHGEHRLSDHSFMQSVVPVIRWIDDRQEKRERPIVYVDVSTLIDPHGQPCASSQKTLRTLIESYQLYFTAPATADHAPYETVLKWLYEYVNVPSWGHTVFTNRKALLYGDYFIDRDKTESMGALIQFGSDTFKTWDDIAEYFSRLGGQ